MGARAARQERHGTAAPPSSLMDVSVPWHHHGMAESSAESTSTAYTIAQLRELVSGGGLRVPQFQRSFRWDAKDVLSLFDSVVKGYPFGSLLLWQREAPADEIIVGALRIRVPERHDALWVVDGQQRVTSLVNAVDPAGAEDPRFALGYSLRRDEVVHGQALDDPLTIPLADLFDFSRALAWLSDNPQAAGRATQVQEVAGRLNRLTVPATVMKNADEATLREVFDRINSRGRRLTEAEIFDAIHGGEGAGRTVDGIAERVAEQTGFGHFEPKTVVQALLIRRHTDISRDIHGEFSESRRRTSDFPEESEGEAVDATERALVAAVRFLQDVCGIPHMTLVPFRFQLLVLVRFFAFFPAPHDRNLELLRRWVWRTSAGAGRLGLAGSQTDLRRLAGCVVVGEESGSVQRLIGGSVLEEGPVVPDLTVFRATRADSKMILAALWNRRPVDAVTGEPITREALAEALVGASTPTPIVGDLVPVGSVPDEGPVAASKIISIREGRDLLSAVDEHTDLDSLLLDESMLRCLESGDTAGFLTRREDVLAGYLKDFLDARTAWSQDDTAPIADFVFDDVDGGGRRD